MVTTALVPEGQYLPIALPDLGITAHWVLSPDSAKYLAVRATCEELGVAPNGQLAKLALDETYNGPKVLCDFRIESAGGRQVTKCLRKAEAALWIGLINPLKVKAELRGRMQEIRAAILYSADRIVFGDRTGALTLSSRPAQGGDLDVGACPRCRAHLGLHVGDPHGLSLHIIESEED
jgi:P22_AR N-terminal domain